MHTDGSATTWRLCYPFLATAIVGVPCTTHSVNQCDNTNLPGGTSPGFMLLAVEYIFGMCLSREHHTHSVSLSSLVADRFLTSYLEIVLGL